jgi:hypothetical protein
MRPCLSGAVQKIHDIIVEGIESALRKRGRKRLRPAGGGEPDAVDRPFGGEQSEGLQNH